MASSQGNASFKAELPLEIAESYDLKIELEDGAGGWEEILGSPLESKILVRSGLVQAAHTHIVTSFEPLTAGETYVWTIQAKDIFENVVLNSEDRINFEIRGPESSILTDIHEFSAGMEYRFQLHEATVRLLGKGSYSGIIKVTQKGGLLATYYATVDFFFPVLRESLHGHAASAGLDTYAPSDATNSSTHFTRLDAAVSFTPGKVSILEGFEASFPT